MAWPNPAGLDQSERKATRPDLSIRNAAQIVHQDWHLHVFFVTQKSGSLDFLSHGTVCGNDFAGVGFAHINKKEFDFVTAEAIIKVVDLADRGRGHGTSS